MDTENMAIFSSFRIPEGRIKHMHGVAEYMYAHAQKHGLDPEQMYILGLLHDIGYVNGKPEHEENGADIAGKFAFCDVNWQDCYTEHRLIHCIRHHGMTPQEYMKKYDIVQKQIPDGLLLLWEADFHIDMTGEDVGYDKRLEGIGKRNGFDSHAYISSKETIEWLKENRR